MERGKKGDRGGKGSVLNHSCHKTLKGVLRNVNGAQGGVYIKERI